jgi:hypothetical protein
MYRGYQSLATKEIHGIIIALIASTGLYSPYREFRTGFT